jgi:hypothetical protein
VQWFWSVTCRSLWHRYGWMRRWRWGSDCVWINNGEVMLTDHWIRFLLWLGYWP